MLLNILKIVFVLSIASVVLGKRSTRVSATLLDGCYGQVDTSPFEKVGNRLYYFGQEKLSWYQAFLKCRRLGGALASIDDANQLNALSNHLNDKYTKEKWWWLSGSDMETEGKFFWYGNGEPFTYTDWSVGQPDNAGGNENCVHLWSTGTKYQMNDWICKEGAYYICETENPKTVAVTLF